MMPLPDQSHLNQVRNALWHPSGGRASVMVGAGFSRNGKKMGPGVGEFPLWFDTAKELCFHLYSDEEHHRREGALAEASGTSGFLRLAQEYHSAFGRSALNELIKKSVPDENYLPGEMHKALLKLPWKDVFTTNWDTLLERTLLNVTNRNYHIVRTVGEISSSNSSRIFKLHGSFPSNVPFIFTEEDYRRYPKDYAPFVNTVQQSMMETVFLLIGFSGEDPNFLHWTGWVRDNLGDAAPKIYLAGWLDLSAHRRRMLENRNVVPIDLARHPQAKSWPKHLRHQYATEWLLKSLEIGEPYNLTKWPKVPSNNKKTMPEYLIPNEGVISNVPKDESKYPVSFGDNKTTIDGLKNQLDNWVFNRALYPGWLILPPENSHIISRTLDGWEKVYFELKDQLTSVERMIFLNEFVFRCDLILNPISEKIAEEIKSILLIIDCHARKVNGQHEDYNWFELYPYCFNLTKALVTSFRFNGDEDLFKYYISELRRFQGCEEDALQFISYEKCLWLLNDFKFEELDKALDKWLVIDVDPIWIARKAAVLIEAGRPQEGTAILEQALEKVRRSERGDSLISSSSRESWMLLMTQTLEFSNEVEEKADFSNISSLDRWKELSHLACDVSNHLEFYVKELHEGRKNKDAQPFDLGLKKGASITFSERRFIRWRAAIRAIKLTEVAGLSTTYNRVDVSLSELKAAAEILLEYDAFFALKLMLRITDYEGDNAFNVVWSRTVIASIELKEVVFLVSVITEFIDYASPKVLDLSKDTLYWVGRLRVAIEALSRLVLRLDKSEAEVVFDKAILIYSSDLIFSDVWLIQPIQNLLLRAWESIPDESKKYKIFKILKLPIIGLKDTATEISDPVKLLLNKGEISINERCVENENDWLVSLSIIEKGLESISFEREVSCLRLAVPGICENLNDDERLRFANAIWNDVETYKGLPKDTNLNSWVLFLLPEPKTGIADQRYKENLFDESVSNGKLLSKLGLDLNNLYKNDKLLELNDVEIAKVYESALNWVETFSIDEIKHPLSGEKYIKEKVCVGLGYLLIFLDFPKNITDKIYSKIISENSVAYVFLYPGLTKHFASYIDSISQRIRIFLSSEDEDVVDKTLLAIKIWLEYSNSRKFALMSISDDILKEVGIIIATRRKKGLNIALQICQKVFAEGEESQKNLIYETVLHGLSYLIEELDYSRRQSIDTVDIPLCRWGCAHLALAMSENGFGGDQVVKDWVSIAKEDPLPEVRNAVRSKDHNLQGQ